MTIIEQNKEYIDCNQTQEHTAFRVVLRTESTGNIRVSPGGSSGVIRGLIEFNPEKVLLRATDFCSAFPYHIIFDRDLKIRQCGDLVQKHSNITLTEGMPLTKAFNIVHPKMVVSIENIRKFINAVFLVAILPSDNGKKTFLLKGQMIWLSDTQNMIFIGSPRLTSLNELMEMNMYLADIPLYDVTRELVLLNQQRIAEIDIAKRLDETTAELKKISQALEEEKSKTETLLHQMLPRNVAKALTNGQKVEAEKFDQVTILFSDIVTFTNIASACSPMDIVNLLNDMYQRFDARTSQHNVYKVETIGDAYMIVSGVPERTTNHAQPVANFAMDMVEDAGLVRSPATGLPLQIRVGVHTGPVVAGVVGMKMPRYCLFGDTVNTASRMESHGVPGRIHLSPTAYESLRGCGYLFKHRGEMEVKGKGVMSTYFLCGYLDRVLNEPGDEFTSLDLQRDSYYDRQNLTCSLDELDETDNIPHLRKCLFGEDLFNSSQSFGTGDNKQFPTQNSDGRNQENTPRFRSHLKSGNLQKMASFDNQRSMVNDKKGYRWSIGNIEHWEDSAIHEEPSNYIKDIIAETVIVRDPSSGIASKVETESFPDCVYINGPFKNEYRQGNSPGRKDYPASRSPSSAATQKSHKAVAFSIDHITKDTSREIVHDTSTQIQRYSKGDNCFNTTLHNRSKGDNCKNIEPPIEQYSTSSICDIYNKPLPIRDHYNESKNKTLTLSPNTLFTSSECSSISKSETFPIPSSGSTIHHVLPSSRSQGNLTMPCTDTKLKKKQEA